MIFQGLVKLHTFVEWVVNWLRRKLIITGHADSQWFWGLRRKKEPGQAKVPYKGFLTKVELNSALHLFELQALQQTTPHFLQWWRRFTNVNWTWKVTFYVRGEKYKLKLTFLQCMHVPASLSGTHTAACSSTAFFPDLRNRSYRICQADLTFG